MQVLASLWAELAGVGQKEHSQVAGLSQQHLCIWGLGRCMGG